MYVVVKNDNYFANNGNYNHKSELIFMQTKSNSLLSSLY